MNLSNKKIIFLDVDGVLATRQQMMSYSKTHNGHCGPGECQIDYACVAILNEIVEKLDAFVVVSSTWRLLPTDMFALMKVMSIACIPVVGMTPHMNSIHGRQADISEYMCANKISYNNILVIDDSDVDLQMYKRRLLRTNGSYGLQKEDVERAINIMKGI
jgi:hypothetical protein